MSKEFTHVFTEAGNGFPCQGEEVLCPHGPFGDVDLLIVCDSGPIQTHSPGQGNTVALVCEPSGRDWDDLSEEEQDEIYESGYIVGSINA
jgi:hypothetical protein